MKEKKALSLAIVLISILSGVFFLALFSSIRCEPDDMIISLEFRDSSFLKTFLGRYHLYSFRPVYTLCSFFTMGYSNNPADYSLSIFAFYIVLYVLLLFAIYKLLQELFSLRGLSLREKFLLLSLSNILILCLYFLTTERIEIFGWVSASIIHLVPVVFVFLSVWLIIKQSKTIDYVLLVIASAIIAGGAEHISASMIASISGILLLLIYNKRKDKQFYKDNKKQIMKGIFFVSSLAVFLIICISNPGVNLHFNEVHQQTDGFAAFHNINILDTIKLFCKPHKLVGLIFLIAFWALFQNIFKITYNPKIKLSYFFVILFCVTIVSAAASIYAYHTLSVGRIWFVLDISLFVLLSACIVKFLPTRKIKPIVVLGSTAVFLITLVSFDIRHIPKLLLFSSEYDKIIYSLQQKPAEETIILNSFPKSDLTNQVELSDDPNNQVNQLFCRFYNIKAKVSVKK
ncbi:MAG TPA: hypothetical protein VF411_11100 [Bacteroidia bacterium]